MKGTQRRKRTEEENPKEFSSEILALLESFRGKQGWKNFDMMTGKPLKSTEPESVAAWRDFNRITSGTCTS